MKNPTIANRRAEKRDRILKSAAKTFAAEGFYHAKISQIARDAGVADGTIYLYFKNKDEILITVFEESVGRIIAEFREELSKFTSPIDKLRKFACLHLQLVETQPDVAAVVQLELRQSNKFIKEYAGSSIADYLNLISEILEDGQRQGLIRDDIHLSIAKRVLFGALDEFSTVTILSKSQSHDLVESARQIAEIFIWGMQVQA